MRSDFSFKKSKFLNTINHVEVRKIVISRSVAVETLSR